MIIGIQNKNKMGIISESYKNKLMRLAGVNQQIINESSRLEFLKKDFEDRVSRKYDKFLKFYSRGSWSQENEPDKFIKTIVSDIALTKNKEIVEKELWIKNMMEIFNQLDNVDPSENKQYLSWLINIFLAGNLPIEDIYKAKEELALFSKNKEKIPLEQRNINSYPDLQSLSEVVAQYSTGEDMSATEKQKLIKLEGAEQVYDSPNWKIIIPKTQDAACLYGKSTKWCTASDEYNRFDYYNKQGPLFILINKNISNDRDTNKKLQFHFESNQFMDTLDRRIDITKFFKSNPELKEFFKKEGQITPAFEIEHMLVSKKEGLQLLKTTNNKIDLIKSKGYNFLEKFYREIGASEEFKNALLNDDEFIKKLFEGNHFSDLLSSYKEFNIENEGIEKIKSLPWLESWILNTNTSADILQSFIFSISENFGEKGKDFVRQLLKPGGLIWTSLLQPNKNKIAHYFSMLSNSKTLGSEGLKMAKDLLGDKNAIQTLKSKGVSDMTIDMLRKFYQMKKESFEAQDYLRHILR